MTLPLLLLFLLGAIDLSRAFQTYIVVTNSAREGARYASNHPLEAAAARLHALSEASTSNITVVPSDPTCFRFSDDSAIACSSAYNGDKISLSVTADFQFVTLYLFRVSTIPISNSATMAITSGGLRAP